MREKKNEVDKWQSVVNELTRFVYGRARLEGLAGLSRKPARV